MSGSLGLLAACGAETADARRVACPTLHASAVYRTNVAVRLERITRDPGVCSGKPCIRGMRVPVHVVVDLVAAGKTAEQILEDFPYLELEDIRQAVAYAAMLTREELLPGV